LFLIILALYANFKVDKVSPKYVLALDIAAIIKVLEFPPRESFKKYVNLLSR